MFTEFDDIIIQIDLKNELVDGKEKDNFETKYFQLLENVQKFIDNSLKPPSAVNSSGTLNCNQTLNIFESH